MRKQKMFSFQIEQSCSDEIRMLDLFECEWRNEFKANTFWSKSLCASFSVTRKNMKKCSFEKDVRQRNMVSNKSSKTWSKWRLFWKASVCACV